MVCPIRMLSYQVMARAVDEGVCYGYRRAHKHTDAPDEETLTMAIYDAVLSSICEVFEFDEPSE